MNAADRLDRDGFVVVEDLFEPDRDFAQVEAEFAATLDRCVERWLQAGRLTQDHADQPFLERLRVVFATVGAAAHEPFTTSLQRPVSEDAPIYLGAAFFALQRHPRLLDAVEQLIGPEIYSHPLQLTRIKLPCRTSTSNWSGVTKTVDWHQDAGLLLPEADATPLVGAWFPMLDVDEQNGCLELIPGSHRNGILPHRLPDARAPMVHIAEEDLPGAPVTVPVRRGSVLFLHGCMVHRSLPNRSSTVRWSFDFRYIPPGYPTGRPWLPGFVARSRRAPHTELRDAEAWAQKWRDTRSRLAGTGGTPDDSYRWRTNASQRGRARLPARARTPRILSRKASD